MTLIYRHPYKGSYDNDERLSCTERLWNGCATRRLQLEKDEMKKYSLRMDMRVTRSGPSRC